MAAIMSLQHLEGDDTHNLMCFIRYYNKTWDKMKVLELIGEYPMLKFRMSLKGAFPKDEKWAGWVVVNKGLLLS